MSESASALREQGTMSFLEHLEELRSTLIRCGLCMVVGIAICLPFAPLIKEVLTIPVEQAIVQFPEIDKSLGELFQEPKAIGVLMLWFKISFWGGLILSMPFILYFIGLFVFPGLHDKEKKAVRIGAGAGAILFFAGVSLAYFFTLRLFMAMEFRISLWMGIIPQIKYLGDYINVSLKVLLAFGLAFELPLIVYLLAYLDLVDADDLRAKRKHVLVGILIMAMFLTPPDVGTQIILAGPLYLLYEITILLVQFRERKEAGTPSDPPVPPATAT